MLFRLSSHILLPFFAEPCFDDEAKNVLKQAYAGEILKALSEEVEKQSDLNAVAYKDIMEGIKQRTNEKGKRLFMPIRAALTGRLKGVELEKVFALLEKTEILERIKKQLA